jgi:hypothetical protein
MLQGHFCSMLPSGLESVLELGFLLDFLRDFLPGLEMVLALY